jgi:hypothetical protein
MRSKETSQAKRNKWDNPNNVRHEASRHFGNKKSEYLKDKI